MIAVIADPSEHDVVREFFELFKTPWEFYCRDRRYDVLLCAGNGQCEGNAKLVVFYSGSRTQLDDQQNVKTGRQRKHACVLSYKGKRIPIYGDSITFPEVPSALLTSEDSEDCVAYLERSKDTALARIGYDIFGEIRTLLTVGQPPVNANLPALELHIAFLRDLIVECRLPLVEIPPVPCGYCFVACLTHDIDHPSIRRHKWDHTMLGYLYRAVFGSSLNLIRGRLSVKDLLANWAAALKLPFVHLGLAKDCWGDFADRYLELENGLPSTFFAIPFKNEPGRTAHGSAPKLRAARYGAQDIADIIRNLRVAGCEVGLHGIDAWLDSSRGREELAEIRRLAGNSEVGARMHWLYYDQSSPAALEKAGAAYDSTVGYNETVGYRAGTTQVYKPLNASQLLELPLHVMDTALFYPGHLGLSSRQASALLDQIVSNAVQFGGALTINWHDRSLAPERLWGACYRALLEDLKSRGVWFATAGQAVSWFRKRRAAEFETDSIEPGGVRAKVAANRCDNLPGLRLRIHNAAERSAAGAHQHSEGYADVAIDDRVDARVSTEARG